MKSAGKNVKETEKRSADFAEEQTPESAPAPETSETESAAETPETQSAEQTPSLEDALKEAEAKAEDYKRKWVAVTAEYENYRKRTQTQSARRYLEGRADVVSKLFPIADNLDRALSSCEDEGVKRGIGLVVKAFEKILEEERITVIDPVGQPFDAEKQEAIMAVDPVQGEESGTVKSVYAKGYEQDGKVLRFAQVVVVK